MRALLDTDIYVYRAAAYHENDPLEVAVRTMNDMIYRSLQAVDVSDYIAFLSSGQNDRKLIDVSYKANRDHKPEPRHRSALKDACVIEWNARLVTGIEADDALGIEQSSGGDDSTICSIDKDLKQIAGYHYNFVKDEYDFVEPLDGIRLFYRQLLTGDRADNIFGIHGIGDVKAKRLINCLDDPEEMQEVVARIYNDDKRLLTNADLLWIHRTEGGWARTLPIWEKYNSTPSETSGGVLRREEEV